MWALFDCISTDASLCRNLPKVAWVIIVILLASIGGLAWLLLGRPEKSHPTRFQRPIEREARPKPRRQAAAEDHARERAPSDITDRRSAELDREIERWEAEQRKPQSRDE